MLAVPEAAVSARPALGSRFIDRCGTTWLLSDRCTGSLYGRDSYVICLASSRTSLTRKPSALPIGMSSLARLWILRSESENLLNCCIMCANFIWFYIISACQTFC